MWRSHESITSFMKFEVTIDNQRHEMNTDKGISLAIPLEFNGQQPNHFGAPTAISSPLKIGNFVGDTRQGSSCNCDLITLTPHCVGTHTESIGHILDTRQSLADCLNPGLIPATLISIEPVTGSQCQESYYPQYMDTDRIITAEAIEKALMLQDITKDSDFFKALIIRTLPNSSAKMQAKYENEQQSAFFSTEAMKFINNIGVQHLLVDMPSIDRMYDDGKLNNHRIFWNVAPECKQPRGEEHLHKSVTEMIYVADAVKDGNYVLDIQIPRWHSDAVPSQPIIYPCKNSSNNEG